MAFLLSVKPENSKQNFPDRSLEKNLPTVLPLKLLGHGLLQEILLLLVVPMLLLPRRGEASRRCELSSMVGLRV